MSRLLTAALAALALSGPAQAFIAENSLVVEGRPDGTFVVPYRGLSGASDFWCAAGDYVVRELHRPVDTRIYRLTSPPRRAGQGIVFGLSPEGAKGTGLLGFNSSGSVSAAHARQLCEVPLLIED